MFLMPLPWLNVVWSVSLPYHFQGYVFRFQVLDATSRSRYCFIDAPDTASWAQHVHLCLPMMILSELNVYTFVPEATFMSMCRNFSCPDTTSRVMCCIVNAPDAASMATCRIHVVHVPDAASREHAV